jgi:hypothetical protein
MRFANPPTAFCVCISNFSEPLQAKTHNGEDYKRNSLQDMVRGILRHINAE